MTLSDYFPIEPDEHISFYAVITSIMVILTLFVTVSYYFSLSTFAITEVGFIASDSYIYKAKCFRMTFKTISVVEDFKESPEFICFNPEDIDHPWHLKDWTLSKCWNFRLCVKK